MTNEDKWKQLNKITTIDKSTIQMLREDIQAELETLNEKYSIKIVVGNGSYGDNNAKLQLLINTIGEHGNVKTKESEDYIREAGYGWNKLKPEWLHESFNFGGDTYKIIGYKPKSRKYPILTERKDGKKYKFDEELIVRYMQPKETN